MRQFLLSTFKRRLLVCSAVPFFLVLAWFALLMLSSLESWRRAGKNYQELVSGGRERCERLYFDRAIRVAPPKDAASTEASTLNQAAESSRLDYLNFSQDHPRIVSFTQDHPRIALFTVIPGEPSDANALWRANSKEQDVRDNQQLMEAITRAAGKDGDLEAEAHRLGFNVGTGPEIVQSNMVEFHRREDVFRAKGTWEQFRRLDDPHFDPLNDGSCSVQRFIFDPPGTLISYALASSGIRPSIFPLTFVGLTVSLLLLTDFTCRVLAENHVGWKRLTLASSLLSAVIITGWWLYDGEHGGKAFTAGLVALTTVGIAFVYGRCVFLWVAAGFSNRAESAPPPTPVIPAPSVSEHESKAYVGTTQMANALADQILQSMQQKTTEELLEIWMRNDRREWSNTAFDAVSQTLSERGVGMPPQGAFVPPAPRYQGVGGWLLLFCIGLTLINPLVFLALTAAAFKSGDGIEAILNVALGALSLYGGTWLWRVSRGAVNKAKLFLWSQLAVSIFGMIALLLRADLRSEQNFLSMVRGVVYFGVWYSYLESSKRVKATYERNQ